MFTSILLLTIAPATIDPAAVKLPVGILGPEGNAIGEEVRGCAKAEEERSPKDRGMTIENK
jgi:hypothetical protein